MSDDALLQLLQRADDGKWPLLLVLDENEQPLPPPRHEESRALSNRYDVSQRARKQGWPCGFSDFVISAELMLDCKRAVYRVSKEKRVVEHVLQSLWQHLPLDGQLHVAGYKQEGIKTLAKRMEQAWDCSVEFERGDGQLHCYVFTKQSERSEPLQAEDYHALREIGDWQGNKLWSKPGIFAWDRIDDGSRFLLGYLPTLLQGKDCAALNALDLGCGYGLLALALAQAGCRSVTATDNNAAAIRAAEATVQAINESQQVLIVADDCGESLRSPFDLIVCNPPFHQGFAVEQELTDRFLQATCRLLKADGHALLVVNAFIPLERKATEWFANVQTVADDGRYKLVLLGY
ncbi:MAG TPA: methyltransferase [Candidatus Acidoferrum sp.]|nr:methyltransferase [Candidatus Acidoferrum sp.]